MLRCQDKNLHIFISQKDAAGGSGAVLYSTAGGGGGEREEEGGGGDNPDIFFGGRTDGLGVSGGSNMTTFAKYPLDISTRMSLQEQSNELISGYSITYIQKEKRKITVPVSGF